MIKRYMEYREMQQLRKDHLMKQRLRMMFIIMAILGVVLLATYAVEAVMPTAPAKSAVTTSSAISSANQQEMQDIQEFADTVTKPLDELEQEDLDLMEAKANDPCYEKNATLPREQMIEEITTCKSLK